MCERPVCPLAALKKADYSPGWKTPLKVDGDGNCCAQNLGEVRDCCGAMVPVLIDQFNLKQAFNIAGRIKDDTRRLAIRNVLAVWRTDQKRLPFKSGGRPSPS